MDPARFPDGTERRAATELRAESGRRLVGHAAVFDSPAKIGSFTEVIRPGAFAASLRNPDSDILALVDHDPRHLIARTRSGTLRLAEDSRGLAFELDVPDTTLGRDLLALVERRDVGGMSFAFKVVDQAWLAGDLRELRAVDLIEVSVVQAWPAYATTTISARSAMAAAFADAIEARRRRLLREAM
jgi:HK97 family phage prohead protease